MDEHVKAKLKLSEKYKSKLVHPSADPYNNPIDQFQMRLETPIGTTPAMQEAAKALAL